MGWQKQFAHSRPSSPAGRARRAAEAVEAVEAAPIRRKKSSIEMVYGNTHVIHLRRIVFDAALTLVVIAGAAVAKYGIRPFQRGYYCNDGACQFF